MIRKIPDPFAQSDAPARPSAAASHDEARLRERAAAARAAGRPAEAARLLLELSHRAARTPREAREVLDEALELARASRERAVVDRVTDALDGALAERFGRG